MNTEPRQPYNKNVILKVLYTFDDRTAFLARSNRPLNAKIITLPPQPPHNSSLIGCIDLKKCLNLVQLSSPELFQKDMDYSLYYKDIIEVDEPFVGCGLYSKLTSDKKLTVLITGRLCNNFISLYSGNSATDTLEIRLRFCQVKTISATDLNSNSGSRKRKQQSDFSTNQRLNSLSSPVEEHISSSSPIISSDDFSFQEPIRKKKSVQYNKILANNTSNSNIHSNNKNLPELATRTQSLPFVTQDSLAHRIRLSDMISSKSNGELDARGEPISSRFSNFQKLMEKSEQPSKAKKSKSFLQSVVRIGDGMIKENILTKKNGLQRCINCLSTSVPPYKFHREGIFEFGNSGVLCAICTELHSKNDTKSLRERGELGSKGLLEGPYSKSSGSKKNGRKRDSSNSNLNSNSNLYSSDFSSSPSYSYALSPNNLRAGFLKSKKTENSKLMADFDKNFNNNDINDILKLEERLDSIPGRNYNQQQSTDLDPIDERFTISERKKSKLQSKGDASVVIEECDEEYYDNIPINATKLNTTLIPMDDDDKENFPPQSYAPSVGTIREQEPKNIPTSLLGPEISPSIQRIIESFSHNEHPVSPSKNSPSTQWNYDFFQENNEKSNQQTADFEDPEINRILMSDKALKPNANPTPKYLETKTPNEKFETTPQDPDTVQTQLLVDNDSPSNMMKYINEVVTGAQSASGTPHEIVRSKNNNVQNETNTGGSHLSTMPSSPFFSVHIDEVEKEIKEFDSTRTSEVWDTKSSPVTEPSSLNIEKQE